VTATRTGSRCRCDLQRHVLGAGLQTWSCRPGRDSPTAPSHSRAPRASGCPRRRRRARRDGLVHVVVILAALPGTPHHRRIGGAEALLQIALDPLHRRGLARLDGLELRLREFAGRPDFAMASLNACRVQVAAARAGVRRKAGASRAGRPATCGASAVSSQAALGHPGKEIREIPYSTKAANRTRLYPACNAIRLASGVETTENARSGPGQGRKLLDPMRASPSGRQAQRERGRRHDRSTIPAARARAGRASRA